MWRSSNIGVPLLEQHGYQMDRDLVDQIGREALPVEVGAAHDGRVVVTDGNLGLLQS